MIYLHLECNNSQERNTNIIGRSYFLKLNSYITLQYSIMYRVYKMILIVALLLGTAVQAQVTVTVVKTDNTTATMTLDESGELYFNSDRLEILESTLTGNTSSWAIDDVRRVLFDGSFEAIAPTISGSGSIALYPNPTSGKFKLDGIGTEPQTVVVYSATGAKRMELTAIEGDEIDVTSLQAGIYFVRTQNHTLKLMKL